MNRSRSGHRAMPKLKRNTTVMDYERTLNALCRSSNEVLRSLVGYPFQQLLRSSTFSTSSPVAPTLEII